MKAVTMREKAVYERFPRAQKVTTGYEDVLGFVLLFFQEQSNIPGC